MSENKRYYWIKLKESFMTSDAVDFLMSQPDGANYVVLYQMLCLKTINTGGRLERHIGEVIIPYDEAKIQRDTKYFTIDTVRVALTLYKSLGLIYVDNNGALCLTDHENLVGSETQWAIQKRNQRTKSLPEAAGGQIPPQCPSVVQDSVHPEIEIRDRDKEIETDKETESRTKGGVGENEGADAPAPTQTTKKQVQRHQYGEFGWVKLTDAEYQKLVNDMGEAEFKRCLQYVDEAAEKTGNKNGWKNWNLVIRACHRDGWGLRIVYARTDSGGNTKPFNYDYGNDADTTPF